MSAFIGFSKSLAGIEKRCEVVISFNLWAGHSEYSDASSDSFIAEKAFWESADRSVHCRVNYSKFRRSDLREYFEWQFAEKTFD